MPRINVKGFSTMLKTISIEELWNMMRQSLREVKKLYVNEICAKITFKYFQHDFVELTENNCMTTDKFI